MHGKLYQSIYYMPEFVPLVLLFGFCIELLLPDAHHFLTNVNLTVPAVAFQT